jgi:hypothetical protein
MKIGYSPNSVLTLYSQVMLQRRSVEGTKTDCGVHNKSLDVRSTTLLVRQYVGSCCT